MDKWNTKIKVYPDGNFIATTSNRPFFLTPAQRLELKFKREAELEKSLEDAKKMVQNYDYLKDKLYGGGEYHQEFMASADFSENFERIETNEIIESLIKKAKKMGIPLNGVVYLKEDGKKPRIGNIRRAKDMIFDLIYLNQFDYFATFTFNPRKKDSFDVDEIMKTVKEWLHNHQKRNNLQYVLVPEYHKSGRIHLHMLYSGDLKLSDSGKLTKKGKPIYNCKSWKYGFSTVIPTDGNRARLAFYVSKYVTKDVQRIFGKYYYSSQGLVRDCPIEYANRHYGSVQAPPVHVDCIDIDFKYDSSIKFNTSTAQDNTKAILQELGVTDFDTA